MLLTLVPLFDEDMAVRAYSFFTQRENFLLNPLLLGTGSLDGASQIAGLELIEKMGLDTLSMGKEIFVPITNISIFTDAPDTCTAPHEKIVFLLDNSIPPVEMYVNRLKQLKDMGYKLAVRKLAVSDFEEYREILKLADYVLLNNRKIAIDKAKIYFGKLYPSISLVAGNIEDMEVFKKLKKSKGYKLYEGQFYRVPITKGQKNVAPLKGNYIDLLNIVNNPDFDLTTAADIIGRDTALTIDLLKMVQPRALNSKITSIRHAAAMLGQRELKKWINTAVANALYADKPNEVTRLSLLRAKFAESLAPSFGLAAQQDELFLLGLFSVLDVILEKPMDQALNDVHVSNDIRSALTHHLGPFAAVYDFMLQYETANWAEVSRQMLLKNVSLDTVYDSYVSALKWYHEVMG